MPTVTAIVCNTIVPASRIATWPGTGYEAQHTDEPVEPGRVDNFWSPVPGDHGARGAWLGSRESAC